MLDLKCVNVFTATIFILIGFKCVNASSNFCFANPQMFKTVIDFSFQCVDNLLNHQVFCRKTCLFDQLKNKPVFYVLLSINFNKINKPTFFKLEKEIIQPCDGRKS